MLNLSFIDNTEQKKMPSKTPSTGFFQGLLSLLLSLALLTGCGGGSEEAPGNSLRIAVIPKGTTHDFWRMVHAGAIKAQRELNGAGGRKIEIIWKGPLKEDNTEEQINLVRTFVSRGIDGMVLAPLDKSALVRPVRDAAAKGVPVVIFDSGLDAEVGKDFATYVATDNYKGGVLGARRLGEVLGGKGKAILLRYQVGSESTMQRENGFLDTMKKEFPGIELISSDQRAGATEEQAYQKSQNLLTRFKDEVNGIFCPNESAAAGMLGALRQAGLNGKVKFVGFDASDKLVQGLASGDIDGLVLQNPINMAYLGVKSVVDKINGGKLEPYVDTGVKVATPENMNTPAMKELHSPDLSKWLDN